MCNSRDIIRTKRVVVMIMIVLNNIISPSTAVAAVITVLLLRGLRIRFVAPTHIL